MFNFHLYNGSWTTRVFVALTVALCIWSILTMTGNAMDHVHEGDEVSGGECYEAVYHEHTGGKSSGKGCYGEAVIHSHTGCSSLGGGCYGQSIFHSHTGSSSQGEGCYGRAVYHSHSGSSSQGGGCYGTALCHTHAGSETEGGACFTVPIYHQHQGIDKAEYPSGCYTQPTVESVGYECGTFVDQGDDTWKCSTCGQVIPSWNLPLSQRHWPFKQVTVYIAGCGKTQETVDGYALSCQVQEGAVEGYSLSCDKSGHVERYELSCGKSEETVEAYGLGCGFEQGQVEYYRRNCGKTTETIEGYVLSCEIKEREEDQMQPVKVPMETGTMANLVAVASKDKQVVNLLGSEQRQEGEQGTFKTSETMQQTAVGMQGAQTDVDTSKQETELEVSRSADSRLLLVCLLVAVCTLGVWLYFKKTVALFYYDETNHYHSLGRIRFQRTQKGYHVEIGNGIRSKATTDRYRIRATKDMQKASEKQHLYVKISTQIMKLRLEEYVDFAL